MTNETKLTQNNRIYWIDNIKGILIFIVVYGHMLTNASGLTNDFNIFGISHYLIYIVHMPMFIIISGYLGKKKASLKKITANLIIPYIIFDLLYMVFDKILGGSPSFNPLVPYYVYWYILCLAILRLIFAYVPKKVLPVLAVISVAASFLSPLIGEDNWRILSMGRVALLFAIYYLGTLITPQHIEYLKKHKIIVVSAAIAATAVELVIMLTKAVPLYTAAHEYPKSTSECAYKYLFMLITVCWFLLFAVYMPNKSCFLTKWGKNSVIIYLVHPFVCKLVNYAMAKINITNQALLFVVIVALSLVLTQLLSLEIFNRIYKLCISKIAKVLKLNNDN